MKPYYIWNDVADPYYKKEDDSGNVPFATKAAAKKDAKEYVAAMDGQVDWAPKIKFWKVTQEEVK